MRELLTFCAVSARSYRILKSELRVSGRGQLEEAVDLFLGVDGQIDCENGDDPLLPATQYGCPIGVWDVSRISDFSRIFDARRNPAAARFNDDISAWDVSNAEDLSAMFYGASDFNQDLCNWGELLSSADVADMFAQTNCPNTGDPTSPEQGPWCHVC